MPTTVQVVTLRQPWLTLPEIVPGQPFEKTNQVLLREAPDYDYTEQELRDYALAANNLFLGLTLDPVKVAALPDGYMLSLYLNVRYGNPIGVGQCPVRQGDRIIVNQHTFGDLCLMVALLSRLYLIHHKSIDKSIQLKAVNSFRLLQRCCWGVYECLQRFPQFETSERHVFAQQTFVGTDGEEDTIVLYFDAVKHQAWLDAEHTELEAVNWWLANGTDPVV